MLGAPGFIKPGRDLVLSYHISICLISSCLQHYFIFVLFLIIDSMYNQDGGLKDHLYVTNELTYRGHRFPKEKIAFKNQSSSDIFYCTCF